MKLATGGTSSAERIDWAVFARGLSGLVLVGPGWANVFAKTFVVCDCATGNVCVIGVEVQYMSSVCVIAEVTINTSRRKPRI